ncbi:hypothetical protein LCGC14_0430120 [marine sediment metagenome]|uniref:Uncharacterized protein n=1 Tax=marine sediment metagenome TaxID=412755 RepID=A0A0F9VAJ2_9ZZZZ
MTLNTKFENCDEWWASILPQAKMWVHSYFHDINLLSDKMISNPQMKQAHDFMAKDKGVECGGSE